MKIEQVNGELYRRLGVIRKAADEAQVKVALNETSSIGKLLDEIKQYEQSSRLDYEYVRTSENRQEAELNER